MAPGKKKKIRHDSQLPQYTSGPTTSSVPSMGPPHPKAPPPPPPPPPPPTQQTSLPPGFFTLPPCDPVRYKPISNSKSMHTIPSSSPAYRTSQHGGSSSMPPSSFTPHPSHHVSQNGGSASMAPSSSPSSSTPSVSRPHVGDSTIPSSPSIDTSTPASDDTQTQTFEEIVSYDSFHRLIIIPDGTTGFVPSNESTKVVVDCVKGFYRDAWSKWSDVPYYYRNQMWNQFRTRCAWITKYNQQISHNFEKKAADRLKNLLYQARQTGERPGWILEDLWDKLIVIWASEEFKKRSNAAKAARASNTGGSFHTGGSISMETHRRRMEKEKGRVVIYAEVFEDKHLKKKKDGTSEWVEPRAARVYEAYQQRFEEWCQSQPDSEDASSTQVSLNDVASIWTQVVGGAKKGRIYGLGSQNSVGRSTTLLYGDSSSQDHEEVEALRKEVEELKEERKEDRATLNKLQSLVENLMSGRPFAPSNGENDRDNEF